MDSYIGKNLGAHSFKQLAYGHEISDFAPSPCIHRCFTRQSFVSRLCSGCQLIELPLRRTHASDALEIRAWQNQEGGFAIERDSADERANISKDLDSSLGAMRHRSDISRCASCGTLPWSAVSRQCLSRWAANNSGPRHVRLLRRRR